MRALLVFHCVANFYSGLTPPPYFFWRACTLKVREELTGTKSDLQVKGVCVILLVVSLRLASPLLPFSPPHPHTLCPRLKQSSSHTCSGRITFARPANFRPIRRAVSLLYTLKLNHPPTYHSSQHLPAFLLRMLHSFGTLSGRQSTATSLSLN